LGTIDLISSENSSTCFSRIYE